MAATMSGKILMDTVDIYTTYGVFAIRGSLNDLVKMPDLKAPSSFDWVTSDGDDVDLRSRKVAGSDISLTFLLSGLTSSDMFDKRDALFLALKADGWRTIYFNTLGRAFQMYYKSCESAKFFNAGKKRIEMVLKFRLKTV